MTMGERIAELTPAVMTLFDPRTDEGVMAGLIGRMGAVEAREIATLACTWVGLSLHADAVREGVSTDQIMERVRTSLEQGAAEYDRLDHEGGLFT